MRITASKELFDKEFVGRPPEVLLDGDDAYAAGRLMRGYVRDGGRFVIYHSHVLKLYELEIFLLWNGFTPILAYEDEGVCGIYARAL